MLSFLGSEVLEVAACFDVVPVEEDSLALSLRIGRLVLLDNQFVCVIVDIVDDDEEKYLKLSPVSFSGFMRYVPFYDWERFKVLLPL